MHKGDKVDLVEEQDSDIIGGFILRVDDKQLDGSIRHQLNELKKRFEENPYVKEF